MKKLMFAAAAMLAGVAMADVTSANIVGYNNNNLVDGAVGQGASFAPISGAKTVRLQDMIVSGYKAEDPDQEAWGEIYAQVLNASGGSNDAQTYYWFDCYVDDGEAGILDTTFYGWYYIDEDTGYPTEIGEDVTFTLGDGLWMYADTSFAWTIQYAGQVSAEDIPVVLIDGAKLCVNATSRTLNINGDAATGFNGITISGYKAEDPDQEAWGEVYAQVLNASGGSNDAQTYYWFDCYVDDGEAGILDTTFYGWYYIDEDTGYPKEIGEDVLVKPGESLWVYADTSFNWVLTFPSAL